MVVNGKWQPTPTLGKVRDRLDRSVLSEQNGKTG